MQGMVDVGNHQSDITLTLFTLPQDEYITFLSFHLLTIKTVMTSSKIKYIVKYKQIFTCKLNTRINLFGPPPLHWWL